MQKAPALPRETLTPAEAAARIGVHLATLAQWRVKGTGPRYIKTGHRTVRYENADIAAWLETRKQTSTALPLPVDPPRAA